MATEGKCPMGNMKIGGKSMPMMPEMKNIGGMMNNEKMPKKMPKK
jgi:hypothetical protein